ncbi:winged helix-turn-helix domain-containing protein [Stutzerimonas urumqiensis]|uniref:transcriptional regulator n=1 Tax=Stutzerimonas urumqiensis TaxID=638269 RepID=UPI003BA8EFD9
MSQSMPGAESPVCLWLKTGREGRTARLYPSRFQLVLADNGVEEQVDLGFAGSRLLERLLASAGEVVSRQELLSHAWEGRVVSQGSLNQQVYTLRQLLSDSSSQIIQTLPRRGYLFNPAFIASPAVATESADEASTIEPEPSTNSEAAPTPIVATAPSAMRSPRRRWAKGLGSVASVVGLSFFAAAQLVNGGGSDGSFTHQHGFGSLQVIYIETSKKQLDHLVETTEPLMAEFSATRRAPANLVVSMSSGFYEFRCLQHDGRLRTAKVHRDLSSTETHVHLRGCLPD